MNKALLIAAVATLSLIGCRNADHGHEIEGKCAVGIKGHEDHDEGKNNAEHEGEIVVSDDKQKTFGIVTEMVVPGEFSEVIHTSGEIISSNGDETTVVAKISGTVNLESLVEGSAVGKGGVIATISSKEIGSGDFVAKARITLETAKKEYDRDIELRKDDIVSESHFDKSKLAYEQAKAEYDALSSGGSGGDGVSVTSPISGFVKKLSVSQGDYVQTGQTIATVSRNKRLQLIADVPENYYGLLDRIKDANFATSYSDEVNNVKALNGKFLNYGRVSDGDCYIPVTFEFDNRGDLFGGSYADVYLKMDSGKNAISVPIASIVEDQGVHYVFVRIEPDAFLKREVTIGQSDGQRVRVISGLNEGEEVVVRGAVQVKLASVTAVPAGHSHNH